MAWITAVNYEDADERLQSLYDRVRMPDGTIDNVLLVHGLRPHTLEGHLSLYRSVLHHSGNSLPKWFLEALGVWVSSLNGCDYCVSHHARGMMRLLNDDDRGAAILQAIDDRTFGVAPLDAAQKAALSYAEILTVRPSDVDEHLIEMLKKTGLDDGEILEINQVCSYFAYANRTVLGLGCKIEEYVCR